MNLFQRFGSFLSNLYMSARLRFMRPEIPMGVGDSRTTGGQLTPVTTPAAVKEAVKERETMIETPRPTLSPTNSRTPTPTITPQPITPQPSEKKQSFVERFLQVSGLATVLSIAPTFFARADNPGGISASKIFDGYTGKMDGIDKRDLLIRLQTAIANPANADKMANIKALMNMGGMGSDGRHLFMDDLTPAQAKWVLQQAKQVDPKIINEWLKNADSATDSITKALETLKNTDVSKITTLSPEQIKDAKDIAYMVGSNTFIEYSKLGSDIGLGGDVHESSKLIQYALSRTPAADGKVFAGFGDAKKAGQYASPEAVLENLKKEGITASAPVDHFGSRVIGANIPEGAKPLNPEAYTTLHGNHAAAVPNANPIAHLGDNIKQTFNNLINPDVRIASSNTGVVSDMGNGILPSQQGVLSGLGQHLQHFAKTAQEAVGTTMRHASDAVGHAWNSEPVQGTLHLVKENSHYLAAGSAAVMLITPAVRAALEKQEKNSSPVPAATIQAKFQNALRVTKAVLTTKISVQDYAKQFNNPQTILAGVRTAGFALATVSPAAAVVATATTAAGVSSLAARVVHAATKDKQGFEKIAAASKYMGDMEYINAATKSVQQTMASVQHTMAGLFGRITQQFKTA